MIHSEASIPFQKDIYSTQFIYNQINAKLRHKTLKESSPVSARHNDDGVADKSYQYSVNNPNAMYYRRNDDDDGDVHRRVRHDDGLADMSVVASALPH